MRIHNSGQSFWVVNRNEVSAKDLQRYEQSQSPSDLEAYLRNHDRQVLFWTYVLSLVGGVVWLFVTIGLNNLWFMLAMLMSLIVALISAILLTKDRDGLLGCVAGRLEARRHRKALHINDDPRVYRLHNSLLERLTVAIRRSSNISIADEEMWQLLDRNSHLVDSFLTNNNVKDAYDILQSDQWAPEAKKVTKEVLRIAADSYAAKVHSAEAERKRLEDIEIEAELARQELEAADAAERAKAKAHGDLVAVQELLNAIKLEFNDTPSDQSAA